MGRIMISMRICLGLLLFSCIFRVKADDPTQFFDWTISYGNVAPFGVSKQVIMINKMFPGPAITTTTNNVACINVHNELNEPFLFTWNGIQQRHDSWQDGTLGTNCPIPPKQNWTYKVQFKDQIGSFFYYPSTPLHKADGGYGAIGIFPRLLDPAVTVPFPPPADEFNLLIGDFFNADHKAMKGVFEKGQPLGQPDGILINGQGPASSTSSSLFTVEQGLIYRLRISNVGIATTVNFRIQDHPMQLVEVEGSYVNKIWMESLDIHVGQSYSVLVTMNQKVADYYMVASARFTDKNLTSTAVIHYNGSTTAVSGAIPDGPSTWDYKFSLNQSQSIRWNLTSGAARPNPQGSYHYGNVTITRTIRLVGMGIETNVNNGGQAIVPNRPLAFGMNGWTFVYPNTPLKLADYFNLSGIFNTTGFPTSPGAINSASIQYGGTLVIASGFKENMTEIVLQNTEKELYTWHLDGYSFFVVGMGYNDTWTPDRRTSYNMHDAVSRSTVEVYPMSWTALLVQLDNKGMWNLRSEYLQRQYLGQELYILVSNNINSTRDELPIPSNVILCGAALK